MNNDTPTRVQVSYCALLVLMTLFGCAVEGASYPSILKELKLVELTATYTGSTVDRCGPVAISSYGQAQSVNSSALRAPLP